MNEKLRYRLLNGKYYYTYGLFDLLRPRERVVAPAFTPATLYTVAPEDVAWRETLTLISPAFPVDETCAPPLCSLGGEHAISPVAEKPLRELLAAAEAACGETILFTSTYRTVAFQRTIYGVNLFAAKPGESEHHSGLAADIKVEGYAQRRFLLTKTCRWLAKNAHRFGFIIRYPLWGERRTGVAYEPWHLRYVGTPHAEILYRRKQTLEDYLRSFAPGVFYRFGDTVLSLQSAAPFTMPRGVSAIQASKNPYGGFLLTGKMTAENKQEES